MRFELEDSEEQAKFRAEVRSWIESQLSEDWLRAVKAGDLEAYKLAKLGWDIFKWMKTIGESGYGAVLWPKEYGGLSGEVWMQQIVREELSAYGLPLAGINLLAVGLAGPTIIAHGTEEQKQRYLKPMLTGEEIWCQLFSEPGAGSDLASVSTRAEKDGDEWIINGQKVWTSIAQFSKFGMLLARTNFDVPKHEGLTYFIVEMNAPGIEIRPLKQMTGASDFNEVFFTDVRVKDNNRVGEIGDGWRCARTTLMNERVALAGLSIDEATFAGSIAKKDPWKLLLSDIRDKSDIITRQSLVQFYIEGELKEITAFRANSARKRGDTPGAEGSVNKVFNAEYNKRKTSFIMDANGLQAIAWRKGDALSRDRATRFLRARANSIEGGTTEVLKNQMAERILGLPRDVEVDRDKPFREVLKSK